MPAHMMMIKLLFHEHCHYRENKQNKMSVTLSTSMSLCSLTDMPYRPISQQWKLWSENKSSYRDGTLIVAQLLKKCPTYYENQRLITNP
jgi:hypothetical protein